MYSAAPDCACSVIAKMPRMMKPKCEIEVYEIRRMTSVWPIATMARRRCR